MWSYFCNHIALSIASKNNTAYCPIMSNLLYRLFNHELWCARVLKVQAWFVCLEKLSRAWCLKGLHTHTHSQQFLWFADLRCFLHPVARQRRVVEQVARRLLRDAFGSPSERTVALAPPLTLALSVAWMLGRASRRPGVGTPGPIACLCLRSSFVL